MRIILSPAKTMVEDADSLAPADLPAFLPQTRQILDALRALSPAQQQSLWKCNDALAVLNTQRIAQMDLTQRLTPALLAYDGIQYRSMAPTVFTGQELDYVQKHLRILSGFYGLLRPFDGVTPYRLEMQAKLPVQGAKDLYTFWGSCLADALAAETDTVLDLASKEYSKAVAPHLPDSVRLVHVVFGQRKNGKIVEKATPCKMARGQMVRFLAQRSAQTVEQAQEFTEQGFRFSAADSTSTEYVFIKEEP